MLQSPDFKELLNILATHEVRYLVVGGYAVMLYSEPRCTKDLDLWIALNPPNGGPAPPPGNLGVTEGPPSVSWVVLAWRQSYSYSEGALMTGPIFDHDKLDVYRLSIEYVAVSFRIAKELTGLHRHARDQWLRAAQSIPLNIAEGNGKRR